MNGIKEKIQLFIDRGELIMKEEYQHVVEFGILMPDYIDGPKSDQWFAEISIFNSRHLANHPLFEQINDVCNNHNKDLSAHKKMMGYLRALLADDELEDVSPKDNANNV